MTASSEPHHATPLPRVAISVTVMVAAVLQTLDNTIANVALPNMQGELSATQDQITWVLTSYIVAAAIMTPLSGWLCARYGRKKAFAACVGLFTLTSALCGLAQTLPEVVAFRTLQGVAGAALMPVSQAILLDINPPEKQARAMSIWSLGAVFGPMMGPILGGWLTDEYNWRWVFFINVPLGLFAFLGTLLWVPETERSRPRIDLTGFALLGIAVGALQLMLDRGQLVDWFHSTEIVIEATISGLALYLFVVHAATTREPFIRLALIRDRNFMAGSALMICMGVAVFSVMSLLPPLLQKLMGQPPTTAGLTLGWRGLGSIAILFVVPRLAALFDARLVLTGGLLVMILSSAMLVFVAPGMDSTLIAVSGFLQGIGSMMFFVMVSTQSFATLDRSLRAEGTAFFSLMRNLGASIGIATMGAVFVSRAQGLHDTLRAHVTPYDLQHLHPDVAAQLSSTAVVGRLNEMVTAQAEWLSYIGTFELIALTSIMSMPLILLLSRQRRPASKDAAAEAAAMAAE